MHCAAWSRDKKRRNKLRRFFLRKSISMIEAKLDYDLQLSRLE